MASITKVLFGMTGWLSLMIFLTACSGGGNPGSSGPQPSSVAATATLVAIDVTPTNQNIALGTGKQLTATGLFSDNTTKDLTEDAAWGTTNAGVAFVDDKVKCGLVNSVAVGSATITATFGNITGSTTIAVTAATLQSIGVTPAIPSIALGTSQQFAATGVFSDHTVQDLTAQVAWISSDAAIAVMGNTADSLGQAVAKKVGSVTISATFGQISGSTTLTVTPATLKSIEVTPARQNIALGTKLRFTATGIFSDNTTQDLTPAVTWGSSHSEFATVSVARGIEGLTTAIAVGSTTISATSGSIAGSTQLAVTPATLVSITVTPDAPSIPLGLSQQLKATGKFTDDSVQDLTAMASWSSSDSALMAVSNASGSNGLALAVARGAVTVMASVGAISGSTLVTGIDPLLVSIAVTPADVALPAGLTRQFTAKGSYSDNSVADITSTATWISSVPGVASVSNAAGSNGLATGLGVGPAVITATLGGKSASASITVTPAQLASISVTPANQTFYPGMLLHFKAIGTFTDNTTADLTEAVLWKSDNTDVALIFNAKQIKGSALGVDFGSSAITATKGNISGTTTIVIGLPITFPANPK